MRTLRIRILVQVWSSYEILFVKTNRTFLLFVIAVVFHSMLE
jgi:hypothetical protein